MNKRASISLKFPQGADNDSILTCLEKQGFYISYSCLSGRCSSCRAKVVRGETEPIKPEEGLTRQEKEQGYILTCVNRPKTDVVLEVDELIEATLEKPRTLPAKIDSIDFTTPEVMSVWLRMPPNTHFKFLPGQYVNLIKGSIKRSYSIAGQDENGRLEFLIKKYPGGLFSQYLFEDAKVNDLLRVEGPLGTFFKRNNPVQHTILLATGTGIAPIKAMLADKAFDNPWADNQVNLFFGCRTSNDVLIDPSELHPEIRFIACFSREQVMNPKAFAGYVQEAVLQSGIDLADSEVYACGSPNMIVDSKQRLMTQGLPEKRFYADAFVSAN